MNLGSATALGIGIGAAVGAALDDIGMWTAIGAALGVAFGVYSRKRNAEEDATE